MTLPTYRDFHLDSTEELDVLIDLITAAKRRASIARRIPGLSEAQKQDLQVVADILEEAGKKITLAQMIVDKGDKA